jgi:hypothetical protein
LKRRRIALSRTLIFEISLVICRFRQGFPEDWKNLVAFWIKIEDETKCFAELYLLKYSVIYAGFDRDFPKTGRTWSPSGSRLRRKIIALLTTFLKEFFDICRFRQGFPEDWKNLVAFWIKIDEEKKRHAENMSFIWNSTINTNFSLATGKSRGSYK